MVLTGKELLRLAKRNGWEVVRQNGSHHRLRNKKTGKKETISVHANKDLPKGTEQKLLKQLGLK
jgi:predicted RNA binding protein YcfA (HicA-like mRNA interferase family)